MKGSRDKVREGITDPLFEDIFTWNDGRERTIAHAYLEQLYDKRLEQHEDKFPVCDGKANTIDPLIVENMNLYEQVAIDFVRFEECLAEIGPRGVNAKDSKGRTLLHALCLFGNLRSVQLLVKYRVKIDVFDCNGFGPLHFCAVSDCHNIAEYLMNTCVNSLDVPAAGKNGRYPIHISAMSASMNMFKLLIGYDISDDGHTISAKNQLNLTRKDMSPNGWHSRTPLWLATYYKHGDIAQLIVELQSGKDFNEFSEPEMSFLYRIGSKLPTVAKQLMDSFIIEQPEKNCKLFWIEDGTLYNKFWHENMFDNLDQGIQLSIYDKESPTLMQIIDHNYIWNIMLIKWKIYGRACSLFYCFIKWVYIILWSGMYVCDSTYVQSNTSINILLVATLAVFGIILTYDVLKILGSLHCVRRFIDHEKRVLSQELFIVKGSMMLIPWCMLKSEEIRVKKLDMKMNVRFISGFSLFEYFVDIFSIVMIAYYTYLFMSGKEEREDAKTNQIRDYINAVLLICMYIVGLSTLRFFEYFAYLIEVLKQAIVDISKWLIIFLVFLIPTWAVLWETIYNFGLSVAGASNTTGNSTKEAINVLGETIRKTHVVYDYDAGKTLADQRGEFKDINMDFWWYMTLIYWFAIGTIILINMLVALMSDSISKIQEKSKMICAYNTMVFQAEIESMLPNLIINRMRNFVQRLEKDNGDEPRKKLCLELPLEDAGDNVSNQVLVNNFFQSNIAKHREDILVLSKYSHDNYTDEAYLSECHKFVSKAAYRKDVF